MSGGAQARRSGENGQSEKTGAEASSSSYRRAVQASRRPSKISPATRAAAA